MKVNIENVGKIKKADIELGDITTIIGQNDSGKSTLGKAIYTAIKPRSETLRGVYEDQTKSLMRDQISKLETVVSKIIKSTEPFFYTKQYSEYHQELDTDLIKLAEEIQSIREELYGLPSKSLKLGINVLLERLLQIGKKSNDDIKILIEEGKEYISEIYQILKIEFEDQSSKERIAKTLFNGTFAKPIKIGEDNLKIQVGNTFINYNRNKFFTLLDSISYDREFFINDFKYSYLSDNQTYDDVILIESPVALNKLDQVSFRKLSPFSETQLLETIINSQNQEEGLYDDVLYKHIDTIENKIKKAIKGNLIYSRDKMKLQFIKSDGEEFDIKDVATGIKSLGTYLLILKKLNGKVILILDEPEVHLHPEWQVILAEILTIIAKMLHTKIVINTHSAFFLEAIENFGEKYKLNNHFYYCEEGSFENVSDNLEKAYAKVNGNAYTMLDKILDEIEMEEKDNEHS